MSLQPIIRAAVCAALVVVCLAGAGWFPTHPVSGQETEPVTLHGAAALDQLKSENSPLESVAPRNPVRDRQIYRPGLRNSFEGHQLSAEELNLVLTQLRRKTGFARMRFDEDGFLTVDDRSQIAGGSAVARELLLAAVDGKKSINLQSHNRSPEVIFARVGEGEIFKGWRSDRQIEVAPIEIDFDDFNHLRGHKEAMEAFDLGFVILHELCHAALELRDPSAGENAAGDCESYVNRIRRELGMPERQQYEASAYRLTTFSSGSTVRIAELSFAQTEPGREPGSRAKTKKLSLRWNVQRVGKIRWFSVSPAAKEKTGVGVSAP